MKKSFMTRALATGLSLAMAFSLSAATNVTTAEAASLMKASSKTVTEGKTAKAYMTSSMAKKYRIKSHKESTVAKKYISVAMMSSRKGLKITAKEGALAAANLEKKGVQVKINFVKASSAKAAKKATKIAKTANLKVVVKAKAVKEEKYSITSAEATGAKTITITLNKAVADATKVTDSSIKVVKGTATKDATVKVDGAKIILTMDTKLTAGSYAVTVSGLETTDLTATVEVAKNEYLTTYEISKELIPDTHASTNAVVYYKALNQYGEMMVADKPTASSSFSTNNDVTKVATATEEGVIRITGMNTALAIYNTKGTVTLVGNDGVNKTEEVIYSAPATASVVEDCGFYKTTTSTFAQPVATENAASYFLMLKFQDQYGHTLTTDDLNGVTVNIAGGITGLDATGMVDYDVKGESYVAIKLAGILKAGTANLNIVNSNKGLLMNKTIEISDKVIIASFTAVAEDGIYNGKENELTYEAIDRNGNNITDYATLFNTVKFGGGNVRWEKKADNSAKLVYEPNFVANAFSGAPTSHSWSKVVALTFYLNEATSGNYKVETKTYTVYENIKIAGVYGLAAGTSTTVASTNAKLEIPVNKIVYLDQYSNKVTSGGDFDAMGLVNGTATRKATIGRDESKAVTACSIYVVTSGAMEFNLTSNDKDGKMVFKPNGDSKSLATVYLKVAGVDDETRETATADNYDYKFTVSTTDTGEVDAATVKIKNIFGGNQVHATSNTAITVTPGNIEVVAVVGGVETAIPSSQYVIKDVKNNKITSTEVNNGTTTKKATVEVQVTTFDSSNNATETVLTGEFTLSTDSARVYKLDKTAAPSGYQAVSSGAVYAIDKETLESYFVFKDQYGNSISNPLAANLGDNVKYEIILKTATNVQGYRVYGNGTNAARIEFSTPGLYSFKIIATTENGDTKDITVDYRVDGYGLNI